MIYQYQPETKYQANSILLDLSIKISKDDCITQLYYALFIFFLFILSFSKQVNLCII